MRDVDVRLVGPATYSARTGPDGIVFLENLTPGAYHVTFVPTTTRATQPGARFVEVDVQLAPDVVTPMASLGEWSPAVAKPIDESACCKPYGAPPARRRVV